MIITQCVLFRKMAKISILVVPILGTYIPAILIMGSALGYPMKWENFNYALIRGLIGGVGISLILFVCSYFPVIASFRLIVAIVLVMAFIVCFFFHIAKGMSI